MWEYSGKAEVWYSDGIECNPRLRPRYSEVGSGRECLHIHPVVCDDAQAGELWFHRTRGNVMTPAGDVVFGAGWRQTIALTRPGDMGGKCSCKFFSPGLAPPRCPLTQRANTLCCAIMGWNGDVTDDPDSARALGLARPRCGRMG